MVPPGTGLMDRTGKTGGGQTGCLFRNADMDYNDPERPTGEHGYASIVFCSHGRDHHRCVPV